MGMGCSRSEHASLQGAHAIRGSARGRGPGCGRNVPSRGRAHPSCALRQQRSPSKRTRLLSTLSDVTLAVTCAGITERNLL